MTNRNNNQKQAQAGASKADTEFASEFSQSKKARKKAARASKNE